MEDGVLARKSAEGRPYRAAVVGGALGPGGRPVAQRRYTLGVAPDPDGGYIAALIEAVPGVAGMTFEASDFEQAFARALVIGEDLAAAAGHLDDGVLVSLTPFDTLAEIGVDTD
jgi:hypothetical protein